MINTKTIDSVADVLEVDAIPEKTYSWDKFTNSLAGVTQYITWPILTFFFKIFFRIKIRGQEIFQKVQGPFIIVANHTSIYDSFLFRLVLGLHTPHLPLRFMAVNKFESRSLNFLATIGVVDFIYALFGVFTVTPGLGIDKNLIKSQEIIKNGGNIVIYPEGRINRSPKVGQFKRGAAILYKRTGVKIIPVAFEHRSSNRLRKTITINVGKVFNISSAESEESITSNFYNTINQLRNRK